MIAAIAFPFVWFGFIFVRATISHGITRERDYLLVDLKSLGNFPFDPQAGMLADVPARFRELDGKRVALDGMMWSGRSAGTSIQNCQLVYNIQNCCFSGPPRVQERVFLFSAPGHLLYYYPSMVRVIGTLHVRLRLCLKTPLFADNSP